MTVNPDQLWYIQIQEKAKFIVFFGFMDARIILTHTFNSGFGCDYCGPSTFVWIRIHFFHCRKGKLYIYEILNWNYPDKSVLVAAVVVIIGMIFHISQFCETLCYENLVYQPQLRINSKRESKRTVTTFKYFTIL